MLIIIIIVSNMAFGSAQFLQTGYAYNTEDNDRNVDYSNDLQCGYLFGVLTQMRLIRLVQIFPQRLVMDMLGQLDVTVDNMISTLCWLDRTTTSTTSLWLVKLYINSVTTTFDFILDRRRSNRKLCHNLRKIKRTHSYVIDKLHEAAGSCGKNNIFYSEPGQVKKGQLTYEGILQLITACAYKLNRLMECNSRKNGLPFGFLANVLRSRRLFMNDLGIDLGLSGGLMTRYDVQVNWADTSDRLQKAWYDAHDLDWTASDLRNIETYYTLHYGFLKVIMFRLIWKHLTGLGGKRVDPNRLYIALDHFKNKLSIVNDQQIDNLQRDIYTYANSKSDKAERLMYIISYLQKELQTICESLGCHLIEPMTTVNETQPQVPAEIVIADIQMYAQCFRNSIVIDKADVELFVDHLDEAFAYVSFDIIQMIIKYIGEINN